jgi:hypothetical protein
MKEMKSMKGEASSTFRTGAGYFMFFMLFMVMISLTSP